MSDPYPRPQYYAQPIIVQSPPRGRSVSGFVLGLVSLAAGWTFVVPIIGLILSGVGLKREPAGKTFAIWGLVLNGLAVIGWVIAVVIFIALLSAVAAIGTTQIH